MEQARLLIAIVLSFLVFFIWSMFFSNNQPVDVKPTQENQEAQQKESETEVEKIDATAEKRPSVLPSEETSLPQKTTRVGAARSIQVETGLYKATLSEDGGTITSFTLKNYKETVEEDSPLKELVTNKNGGGAIGLGFEDNTLSGLKTAAFECLDKDDIITIENGERSVGFRWVADNGIVLLKRYTFHKDSYLVKLEVNIQNHSDGSIQDRLYFSLLQPAGESKNTYGFQGPSGLIGSEVEQVKQKKIEEKGLHSGKVKWVAIEDRYFISSIMVAEPVDGKMKITLEDGVLENRMVMEKAMISPQEQANFDVALFFGPKSMQVLKGVGNDMDKAINFGMFDIIAKPCLLFMNLIYKYIPNYGIAIIILTLCTKILLWPLGSKSYKSMNAMKKLQPLMGEIREKYKHDKKMMNQELMALYKTYKINPMGGCLPMVLQIPVFFALYRMLYQAIELRHAPFLLWINDLSAPDRLFHFDFSIPLMQPPAGIPVLTIIMGASMILQQKMSPPPGDPAQAKMMMFMPLIFTFIFINFSSGLVLYWLVNNVLSIAQQYYIQQKNT